MKLRPSKISILLPLILFLITLLAGFSFKNAQAAPPAQQTTNGGTVYFPLVSLSGISPEERLAELLKNHPDQVRQVMYQDPILTRVAEEKAMDMAVRAYFSHVNPEGVGPNYLVEQAGYSLPVWYCQDLDGNNIESIAGGFATPEDVLSGLLTSEAHRKHLLGESSFFAEQLDYGIGFVEVPGSPYTFYWVIITARH